MAFPFASLCRPHWRHRSGRAIAVRAAFHADRPEHRTSGVRACHGGRMVNPRNPSPGAGDQIGDSLHLLRFTGGLYCRAELSAPWGVEFPALENFMMLPVVLAGRCILEIEGERHILEAGSAALITRGVPHRMLSADRK